MEPRPGPRRRLNPGCIASLFIWGLELRAERFNHGTHAKLNVTERAHNWRFDGVCRRFRDRVVTIKFKIETVNCRAALWCEFEAACELPGFCVPDRDRHLSPLIAQDCELAMFIFVGNVAKDFRPLYSVVRLVPLNGRRVPRSVL